MKFKHFFKVLFGWIMVKIRSGPLRGKKWILTTGSRFVQGKQEIYKTEAFLENFKKSDVFFDIGAHVGYFSAIAALINEGSGGIYSFEPRPMNICFFKKHMKANNFKNVILFEVAVGATEEQVRFNTGKGSATGHVSQNGRIRVKQVSIDKMVNEGVIPYPDFIKIDVEGGECEVLKGAVKVITSVHPKIIVATHNAECHRYVIDFLKQNKYHIEILNPDSIKGDTEIVAIPA